MTNNLSYYHIVLEGTKAEAANAHAESSHWGAILCSMVSPCQKKPPLRLHITRDM